MIEAATKGIFLGLVLSALIGPVFFLLIQTSIVQGIRAALIIDAGVFLSDLIYLTIAYLGAASIIENLKNDGLVYIPGGIILIVFGIFSFIKKHKPQVEIIKSKANDTKLFLKGFILNSLNPSVLLFWAGTVILAYSNFESNHSLILTYFVFTLFTVFTIDIIKIILSGQLRRFINTSTLSILNKATGIILISIGLSLIYKGF
jgi:threonine/homoserine/homoserine lactone efflux protein